MTIEITPILSDLRERLQTHYGERLEKLVLYGSQARGDADPDSDIDVLVVLKDQVDEQRELDATLDMVVDFSANQSVLVSLLFVSLREYTLRQSPIMINIRREGITL